MYKYRVFELEIIGPYNCTNIECSRVFIRVEIIGSCILVDIHIQTEGVYEVAL